MTALIMPGRMSKFLCIALTGKIARPIETGAGIGLAQGGDVAMAGDPAYRIGCAQRRGQSAKRQVLGIGERDGIAAFQLYADGIIIAAHCTLPA